MVSVLRPLNNVPLKALSSSPKKGNYTLLSTTESVTIFHPQLCHTPERFSLYVRTRPKSNVFLSNGKGIRCKFKLAPRITEGRWTAITVLEDLCLKTRR